MTEPSTTSGPREAPAAEAAPRIAPRRKTAEQRLRIRERLTTALTVAHIARVQELTARGLPKIIAEMLASRETDPPAGFVQLQIARLSEAMIVTRTRMMEGDLQAVDRMIKFTGEIRPLSRLRAGSNSCAHPEMAPQRLEKIESARGNGMVSEAFEPQDLVYGRAADRARLRPTSRENDEAKFFASQPLEITENRESSEPSPPRISPPRSYGEGSGVGLFVPVDEALEVSGSGARPTPCPLPARAGRGDPPWRQREIFRLATL